jgi:hypothetical protein
MAACGRKQSLAIWKFPRNEWLLSAQERKLVTNNHVWPQTAKSSPTGKLQAATLNIPLWHFLALRLCLKTIADRKKSAGVIFNRLKRCNEIRVATTYVVVACLHQREI